ncbi:MAG TPA: hypothetical protein VGG25_12010 [Streptosporangiaceae bacterium]|jgi:hypothetical protein
MADWNAELFTKLYSKMALALGVTPTADTELHSMLGAAPPRRFRASSLTASKDAPQFLLAIFNPGQYIPASMDPVTKPNDRYALSVLFNAVPQFSWVYRPAATTISNAYKSILDYKETPLVALTPEQKKKLEEAQGLVDEYQDAYEQYQGEYFDVLDAYDAAYATWLNGGAPVPRSLKAKLEAALAKWDRSGHRTAVDSATAVIATYEALDPETFWYKLSQRYRAGTESAEVSSEYQVVGVSPPYKTWFGDAGWTSFSFDQKDMDNQRQSQAIGVSGRLEGEYGIFRISGEGSYEKDSKFVKMDQTELQFSCKLFRVALDRSWMNPLVLSSRAWRWAQGTPAYGSHLSTGGDIFNDVAPTGEMTVVPTAAILSKDLNIKGNFNKTIVEEMNSKIAANASVGIGPFSISGRFNMEDHSGSEKGTIASNGISAPDVQLVAFVCEVLPASPNHDPALKWPTQ